MLPASFAAEVPVFMATPTSACASAGASFVPSPVIATMRPFACSSLISAIFASGVASARKSSTPASCGDHGGGDAVVAGDHHRADPHPAQLVEALAHAALDDVLQVDRRRARSCPGRRRAACRRARRSLSTSSSSSAGDLAALLLDEALDRVGGALADHRCRPCRRRSSASSRENGMNVACSPSSRSRRPYCSFASTTIERPSGVSSASEASCATSASSALVDAVDRDELGRLAVAERDRAGLVEQQHVDVAGGLDRAARHREHVALHEPVHAGDPDRREQRADRGRDQRDEQRDQHGLRRWACRRRARTAAASRPRRGT